MLGVLERELFLSYWKRYRQRQFAEKGKIRLGGDWSQEALIYDDTGDSGNVKVLLGSEEVDREVLDRDLPRHNVGRHVSNDNAAIAIRPGKQGLGEAWELDTVNGLVVADMTHGVILRKVPGALFRKLVKLAVVDLAESATTFA